MQEKEPDVSTVKKLKNFNGRPGRFSSVMDGVGLGKRDKSDGVFKQKHHAWMNFQKQTYNSQGARGRGRDALDEDIATTRSDIMLGAGRVLRGRDLVLTPSNQARF